jgi:hypothetical protein
LEHSEDLPASGISGTLESRLTATKSQIVNLSHRTSDEEAQYLTSLLIYHLVERFDGQLQFTAKEIQRNGADPVPRSLAASHYQSLT